MQALPELSESELPPAVGLVLRLASESASARGPAAQAVRRRLRAARGGLGGGTLDALRLAARQSDAVASALLADIDADCRAGNRKQHAADSLVSFAASTNGWVRAVGDILKLIGAPHVAAIALCSILHGASEFPSDRSD